MLVDKSCRILIDGLLGGYHYPERSPGQANNDNFEVPFRDGYYEHVCNAVEYVAINVFRAVERHTDDRMRKYKYRSRTKETANAGFSFAGAA
jgi:hypothetical protein